MKKAQVRQSKEILKEKGGVICAERLVFRMLQCAEDLFNYIGYAEKSLLPEINYALEVAHENLDLK